MERENAAKTTGNFTCLLCDRGARTLGGLARHVFKGHGREAKEAYRRGKWVMATATGTSKGQPESLFDAIDALAAEQKAELEGLANAIPLPPMPPMPAEEEIAGQKDATSMPGEAAEVRVIPSSDSTDLSELQQPYHIEPKADLVVGATGSGKTTNIGEVSDYVLAKYGKLTRMASTDPSGPGPLIGLVRAGQVEFWAVHAWPKPIEAMYKSTLGYWPLRVDDPESPLVPPDAGTYEAYGFGAFEGLTSYGDTILAELKRTRASLSQDPSYTWAQGDFSTSGGNQSYYGMMQDTLNQWVIKTHLLRYEKVLWTALESRGKDKDGNVVYGPMIGGKQATGKAGQWFCNFFHMDIIAGDATTDPNTKQTLIDAKHVLFLRTHIDPMTMIPFPCKVRAPKEFAKEVPSYLDSGSIAEAYKLLDGLFEKQEKGASVKLNEIAGLRERLVERAAKARLKEAEEAEKRAKAAKLLKPMVTVPAMPILPSIGGGPVGPATKLPVLAGSVVVAAPLPATVPKAPAGLPAGVPMIQNVRKGK